jgi:hypothetical protein
MSFKSLGNKGEQKIDKADVRTRTYRIVEYLLLSQWELEVFSLNSNLFVVNQSG